MLAKRSRALSVTWHDLVGEPFGNTIRSGPYCLYPLRSSCNTTSAEAQKQPGGIIARLSAGVVDVVAISRLKPTQLFHKRTKSA